MRLWKCVDSAVLTMRRRDGHVRLCMRVFVVLLLTRIFWPSFGPCTPFTFRQKQWRLRSFMMINVWHVSSSQSYRSSDFVIDETCSSWIPVMHSQNRKHRPIEGERALCIGNIAWNRETLRFNSVETAGDNNNIQIWRNTFSVRNKYFIFCHFCVFSYSLSQTRKESIHV